MLSSYFRPYCRNSYKYLKNKEVQNLLEKYFKMINSILEDSVLIQENLDKDEIYTAVKEYLQKYNTKYEEIIIDKNVQISYLRKK